MSRRTIALIMMACAGFAVLMLAASASSVPMWHDPPPSGAPESPRFELPEAEPEQAEQAEPEADDDDIGTDIIAAVFAALLILVALAVGWAIVALVASWIRNRRRRPAADLDRELLVLPEGDLPVVELDVEAQLAALAHGSPRNAIVACWLRLEDDVAAAGLPRHVAETSAEFTTRVLASYALDPSPVIELAALYREACFSLHTMEQTDRDRALVALRSVHASLDAAARVSHEAAAP